MTEETAKFLLTDNGRALLDEAQTLWDSRAAPVTALTRLRQWADSEQAATAWTMADLRRRAFAKFGDNAARMYFVRDALEQASSARAATYHAARFANAGVTHVTDLCGGIGGDSLAFARAGLRVTLIERDPVRALFAGENACVHGFAEQITVVQADVMAMKIETEAAWFDPARRGARGRLVRPDDYAPPLSFLRDLQAQGIRNVGVKLAPAIDHSVAAEYGAELEFISDLGECKEALLWLGALGRGEPLRAVLLEHDGPNALTGDPNQAVPAAPPNGRYLYEPDPSVIRAHLVGVLARQLDAAPLDPQIAYLVGDSLVPTPYAAAYKIVERFPYHRKRLQAALDARDVGQVVIKKRGFPLEPDEIRRLLKLSGSQLLTVVLTRIGSRHIAFLCRPVLQAC